MPTAGEALRAVGAAHKRYLEATYHLSHRRLVRERRRLLDEEGTVIGEPWLEGAPGYLEGKRFNEVDTGLPPLNRTLAMFHREKLGAHDPPYRHQQLAIEAFFRDRKDLVVSTGTGSGKTEVFLYAILGHLFLEAQRSRTVDQRACRAIILYPMNALVSDQLTRLRRFFGSPKASRAIKEEFGRAVQFGMYTGRTPYHGMFSPEKNNRYVSPVVRGILGLEGTPTYERLQKRGRIPAKDLRSFNAGQTWRRFRTQPGDAELLTRQEMLSPRTSNPPFQENINPHGGTPDILVTNYSMLEYTLIRPIEQPFWEDTRKWLKENPGNQILIVLDEAHLYRGAQGAEISLLIARFLRHLDIRRDRVRFILTSASIASPEGGDTAAKEFAAKLTLSSSDDFAVIFGEKKGQVPIRPIPDGVSDAVRTIGNPPTANEIRDVAKRLGWAQPPLEDQALPQYVGEQINAAEWFRSFRASVARGPQPIRELAKDLMPTLAASEAAEALLSVASLVSYSQDDAAEALLPLKLHLLFRGLPRLYACINDECEGRRDNNDGPLGRLFTSPVPQCLHCNARVFEIWSHRDCGAVFLHAYRSQFRDPASPEFIWSREAPPDGDARMEPVVLLAEKPRVPDPPAAMRLSVFSGMLSGSLSALGNEKSLEVWPAERRELKNRFVHCPACGDTASPGPGSLENEPFGSIMDLETKGEAPFANLVKALFEVQPPSISEAEAKKRGLPNRGRKVLCFADSRQKAARLARDLQRAMERDAFREILAMAVNRANLEFHGSTNLNHYYIYLLEVCREYDLALFDGDDRDAFLALMKEFRQWREAMSVRDIAESHYDQFRDARPPALTAALLRALCDRHYSMQATLVGATVARSAVIDEFARLLGDHARRLERTGVEAAVADLILRAQSRGAVDSGIGIEARQLVGKAFTYRKKPEEFGLNDAQLFPLDTLTAIHPAATEELAAAMTLASKMSRLVSQGQGGYYLQPASLQIQLTDEGTRWFRCRTCSRPTPSAAGGRCPWYGCGGGVVEVTADDDILAARKNLFRVPVLEVIKGGRAPYTLRAEEHTAQLNAWSPGEMFARPERYELLFQDILVGSDEEEAPRAIDVLSCTTTMEVGIDIGSLTGVALRTIPPRPDNYQQRAGRAGRRGSALSVIISFADLQPYEQFVFEKPETLLSPPESVPVIHTGNERIVERHIFALVVQGFFHRTLPDGRTWRDLLQMDVNLFESLGTLEGFFAPPKAHEYDYNAFQAWLKKEMEGPGGLAGELAELLPAGGPWGAERQTRAEFVRRSTDNLLVGLQELAVGAHTHPDGEPINLIEALIRANLRPAFGFPLDLCTFSVVGKLRKKDAAIKRQYEPQQDLQVALTEYAPGRSLVIDKREFSSYGIHVPFPADRTTPAASIPWPNLPVLAQCSDCDSVLGTNADPARPITGCDACGGLSVKTYPWFRPAGFSPRVSRDWVMTEREDDEDPVGAVPAKLPTPDLQDSGAAAEVRRLSRFAELLHARNQRLVVSNLGPENGGYSICTECGAITEPSSTGHERPFPLAPWLRQGIPARCISRSFAHGVAFAHEFKTDLLLLRIEAGRDLDYQPRQPWFHSAALSLAEALAVATSRHLRLERGEIRAGWRPLLVEAREGVSKFVDIYIYDGTPGGAGFATKALTGFDGILDTANKILSGCLCESACIKCILTYDNKHDAPLLDRNAALSLLAFVREGRIPALPPGQLERYRNLVQRIVRLRFPSAEVVAVGAHGWEVKVDGVSLPVAVRSALQPSGSMQENGDEITDYMLRTDPVATLDDLLLSLPSQ